MNNHRFTRKIAGCPIVVLLLLWCFGSAPAFALSGNGNGNAGDKIRNYKILENSYSERCGFKYHGVVKVRYTLKSSNNKDVVITGTDPDGYVRELTRRTVDYGRGAVVMNFDAGDCLADINIHME